MIMRTSKIILLVFLKVKEGSHNHLGDLFLLSIIFVKNPTLWKIKSFYLKQ